MNRSRFVAALLGSSVSAVVVSGAGAALAEAPPPPDVVVQDAPPPHRWLAIGWNPLGLFLDRLGADVVLTPGDHHGVVLSPFYTWASTVPYATSIDAGGNNLTDANGTGYTLNVLSQTFKGFGGELGYRYYFDRGGPRGPFVGPSLIVADITATSGNGKQMSFVDYGVAADVGYSALIADAVAVSVGGGLQYTTPSRSIPDQQLPASIYANSRLYPRLLLALGYAF